MLLYPGISIFTLQPENKMNRFLNWVNKGATNLMGFMGFGKPAESLPSATEQSLPPATSESNSSQPPVSFLSAAANGLTSLPGKIKNMASGLVTSVVGAAKGAVNMVTTGYNAVKRKAADMVEKVQDNVVSNVIALAVKKFKTWVSDHKGLVTAAAAALAAVLAFLFWPVVAALGGLLSFAATKKTALATADEPLSSAHANSPLRMMRTMPSQEDDADLAQGFQSEQEDDADLAQGFQSEEDDADLAAHLAAEEIVSDNEAAQFAGDAALAAALEAEDMPNAAQFAGDAALAAGLEAEDMPVQQANVDQAAHPVAPAPVAAVHSFFPPAPAHGGYDAATVSHLHRAY